MALKAKSIANLIHNSLLLDIEEDEKTDLYSQYTIFKQMLIHDMTPKDFGDMYAQTITYGMFTARLHDNSLDTFSRQEAAELLPNTNPFLQKLFRHIAGYDLDTRISWAVDSLVKIFRATDVKKLLSNFGTKTQRNDPIIHFYEEFLAEFDPKLRKSRGVWYTPEPVVKFIVRAVDEVLINEFDLPKGLADSSKTTIKVDTDQRDARSKTGFKQIDKEIHKVQVLDPATGTGTFLAETIKFIHEKKQYFKWSNYVENDLLPRIHGFEIVMASYAMAHLKLDLLLNETGYEATKAQRLKVYLTNSLEAHHEETGNLFSSWLATESQEADRVKKDTPVMVVMGNPPYAVSSSNKSNWIQNLIADYKKDLNEKNIQPLSDDYIKFIRYGQHYIEKNGEGILAYISNNSFIDGIIHRQMRKSLLECFDKIYILDLHGNAKKKEVSPDGSKDENVFDIMQGVSINIFVKKKSKSKKLADVFHYDLFGKRDLKYSFLNKNTLKEINWNKLDYKEPEYFFVKKDFKEQNTYDQFFKINELFLVQGSGIKFRKDNLLIKNNFSESNVITMINDMKNLTEKEVLSKYNFNETSDWIFEEQKKYFQDYNEKDIRVALYRPFDYRFTYYPLDKISNMIPRGDSRKGLMKNFFQSNLGLIVSKQFSSGQHFVTNITNCLTEITSQPFAPYNINPLYLYPDENSLTNERTPNLNLEIVKEIEDKLNLKFVNEKEENTITFAPIDILDYIYAVLHSPNYREKYKEFLKIDFPRVPFPNILNFWQLVEKGSELRSFHLLENPKIYEIIIELNDSQNNTIERKIAKTDIEPEDNKIKLWLNDEQYIDNIPKIAWEFYIGGYQPAQKWLKDRVGRELKEEDYEHYNKIIVALLNTDKIMKEIDNILIID